MSNFEFINPFLTASKFVAETKNLYYNGFNRTTSKKRGCLYVLNWRVYQ